MGRKVSKRLDRQGEWIALGPHVMRHPLPISPRKGQRRTPYPTV